jgi:hypothetical protein
MEDTLTNIRKVVSGRLGWIQAFEDMEPRLLEHVETLHDRDDRIYVLEHEVACHKELQATLFGAMTYLLEPLSPGSRGASKVMSEPCTRSLV